MMLLRKGGRIILPSSSSSRTIMLSSQTIISTMRKKCCYLYGNHNHCFLSSIVTKKNTTITERIISRTDTTTTSNTRKFTTTCSTSSNAKSSSSNNTKTNHNINSNNNEQKQKQKQKVELSLLDLRSYNLSVVERLCIEEILLRSDPKERSWVILGNHHPTKHKYLQTIITTKTNDHDDDNETKVTKNNDSNSNNNDNDNNCIIVMGIGGKPKELLNIPLVRKDSIQVIKRFSGGGTVVIDKSSILTTFIGRTIPDFPNVEPYPRSIMKWSSDCIFKNVFNKLNNNYNNNNNFNFNLRENDYVLGSNKKCAGNAQSIIKNGWLHHTSFLWDYNDNNMLYLSIPKKQPKYRQNRSHDNFLIKLKDIYHHYEYDGRRHEQQQQQQQQDNNNNNNNNDIFYQALYDSLNEEFKLNHMSIYEALNVRSNDNDDDYDNDNVNEYGSKNKNIDNTTTTDNNNKNTISYKINDWFYSKKCRTKYVNI